MISIYGRSCTHMPWVSWLLHDLRGLASLVRFELWILTEGNLYDPLPTDNEQDTVTDPCKR